QQSHNEANSTPEAGKSNWRRSVILIVAHQAVRNHWLLVLFLHTGLRVSEMAGLSVGDVSWNGQPRQRLYVPKHLAKGGRSDGWVPLNTTARQAISEILAFNHRYGFSGASEAAFLTTRKHTHISARSIQALVQKLRERAGLDVPATPHVLRHTFISKLSRHTNLVVVQQAARHRRLETLRVYAHARPEEVCAAVEQLV
ncbi:MAG: tyrosine-type recombinase/integrase, partial [Candidatus Xenobia bacterium]